MKIRNPSAKKFFVVVSYKNPAEGTYQTGYFDNEEDAKEYAARTVVVTNGKQGEAVIYEAKRVARVPVEALGWKEADGKASE